MVETCARQPQMSLALLPQGTRKRVERFKTSFWRTVQIAEVPGHPVALDYGDRCLVLGKLVIPAADIALLNELVTTTLLAIDLVILGDIEAPGISCVEVMT